MRDAAELPPTASNTDTAAQHILSEIRRLKKQSLAAQLSLIEEQHPTVFADAERFLAATNYLPWEFPVAFDEGEVGALVKKYAVPTARHRPSAASVSPLTDLFAFT
jgi:hypothetical protein